MSRYTQRRRIVAATVVAGALLLAGPAAYGVATAAGTVDNPVATSSEQPDGSDGEGDGDQNADGEQSQDQNQDKDGDGNQDEAQRAAADKGENAAGGEGDKDGSQDKKKDDGGLDVLATDCSGSKLEPHDGFQKAPRCVSTAFGEVAAQAKSPSLLITDSPEKVAPGQGFQLKVSTRNLVRDRFLAAAQGGYYKESSVLNGEGLQRGHFHTACRSLPSTDEAPDASPKPDFFLATQDGSGSSTPDTTTIDVPGVAQGGELQCASWAGDGSHRIPMMQRADQTPAFDSVRIRVG